MRIGTKSVLFGAHQFMIHPFFVAAAWWKLFGFPWDPRLWLAFFLHDLGYFGKPNMDGAEGETHPVFAARIMGCLFGSAWSDFVMFHSRFLAKTKGRHPSLLCVADKLSIALTPAWLYLPMVRRTREIDEYMKLTVSRGELDNKYASMKVRTDSQRVWFADVQEYLRRWVEAHRDGGEDLWTPDMRKAQTTSGVWK